MPTTIAERIQAGLEHHQAGRLRDAENTYRSVLAEEPQHADALHLLGVVALQSGNASDAAQLIEQAIEANPGEPQFYNMCGEAWLALGKYATAIERYEQALKLQPDIAGVHNNLGNAQKSAGNLERAVASYRRAIAIDPDFAMSHNNLGIALKELGNTEEAITHFRQAVVTMPDYAEAHSNLGNALASIGREDEAVGCHERAIAARPDYAEGHSNLANALKGLGRWNDALSHYRQAITLRPDFAMAHYNLGIALSELGRPADAASSYEQAIAIDPAYAEAHNNLGNVLDELGRRDDAIAHYEQAVSIRPAFAEAQRNLARLKADPERAAEIEKIVKNQSINDIDAIHAQFALGDIRYAAEAYDEAFEHYREGNALKRKTLDYDPQRFTQHVDKLIATYSRDYFDAGVAGAGDSDLPVFIVGMPRSGTTLVEQIVSSHPEVHGAGELAALGRFERVIDERFSGSQAYPESMRWNRQSVTPVFSKAYLDAIRQLSPDARRVTDKMPDNFMRIGLIKTLLPNARIIHCLRNPLDTCTSNFVHYFATGNDYSFDLLELGKYYLDYERLMAHWSALFRDNILTVHYEELVREQEKVSRQLIRYLGLEWDARCLDFHLNERAVHTFSSQDVRQPVYTRAIGRWQRFEKQLAPLIATLDGREHRN